VSAKYISGVYSHGNPHLLLTDLVLKFHWRTKHAARATFTEDDEFCPFGMRYEYQIESAAEGLLLY
jgi:hypothetical protein